jgi:hypothetical protein
MKKRFENIIIAGLLICIFTACNNKIPSELTVIPVAVEKSLSLPLSEIAENIQAVHLELTDESLISQIRKVLLCDNYIIVLNAQQRKHTVMLFSSEGKFIRQIGSAGQGPGEYPNYIKDITVDTENKHIFLISHKKLICYNFDGELINEFSSEQIEHFNAICHVNNRLLLISEHYGEPDGSGFNNRSLLYISDTNLQLKDSVEIWKVHMDRRVFWTYPYKDFITYSSRNTYLYYYEITPEPVPVQDILYEIKDNQLIPSLKLAFKGGTNTSDGGKIIYLYSIFRSSRYVFSAYYHGLEKKDYYFCYDTKTGNGHTVEGYIDDINKIEDKVIIHPLNSEDGKFYYLHTNTDDVTNNEEPNPTLYIGKLKK